MDIMAPARKSKSGDLRYQTQAIDEKVSSSIFGNGSIALVLTTCKGIIY